jgi:hypothetical protein
MAKPSCRRRSQQESVFAAGFKAFFDSIGQQRKSPAPRRAHDVAKCTQCLRSSGFDFDRVLESQ